MLCSLQHVIIRPFQQLSEGECYSTTVCALQPDHIKKGYCPRLPGVRMPATYINHYAANGGVVVPQFGGMHHSCFSREPPWAISRLSTTMHRMAGLPSLKAPRLQSEASLSGSLILSSLALLYFGILDPGKRRMPFLP